MTGPVADTPRPSRSEGDPVCPMPERVWSWPTDAGEATLVTKPCGQELHVMWTVVQDIGAGSTAADFEVPSGYDTWRVECSHGHRLMLAPDTGDGAEEPFDPAHLDSLLASFEVPS